MESSDYLTVWVSGILIPNILDHKQAFLIRFSDHHLNTKSFDNQTQFYHLNTGLVQYLDGYCTDHSNSGHKSRLKTMVTEKCIGNKDIRKLLVKVT